MTTPPELSSEQISPGVTPEPSSAVLLVIQGKVFSDTKNFGSEGSAYLQALAQGFQQALPELGMKVFFEDGTQGVSDVKFAKQALKPSHEIHIGTSRVTRKGATLDSLRPVSASWEMDVSTVRSIEALGGAGFASTRIYTATASGDTCIEGDNLAARCGAEMGKLLADSLRAAHVIQLGGANSPQ